MSDWIEWDGGDCPVPRGTRVDVQHRDGDVFYNCPAGEQGPARFWAYNRCGGDIIHYRLHKPKSEIDTRIANLERELEALKRARAAESELDKWEPEGGNWTIGGEGSIRRAPAYSDFAAFGTERPTRELAEKARDAMRVHNRALAYVHELAPGWDGTGAHAVEYVGTTHPRWVALLSNHTSVGTVTGPRHVMQKLADDLNSGRVVL